MTLPRSLVLLVLAALAGGALIGLAFGAPDGALTIAFLLACGVPVLVLAHVLAPRRRRLSSLRTQFMGGIALSVGLVLLGVGVIAAAMFVSAHDAVLVALLLVFAGGLVATTAALLAGGVMRDIETVRDGLREIGEGRRDVTIETVSQKDELAELAGAGAMMLDRLVEGEARREAVEASRRDLLAAVSHDLRTPLTSLTLLARALQDDLVDPPDRRRYLEQMTTHLHGLNALINDLFELSRLEAGETGWSIGPVLLPELAEETVEAMSPHARAKQVQVEADVPSDLPAARANPEAVQRVLFNLIQNAIRHTPSGGRVTLAATEGDGGESLCVEVADSGEGVSPVDRERVFESFFRGGSETSRTRSGAGLGLTICRAIVEAHGGRIWLAPSERGASVRFSLPAIPSSTE